MRKLLLSLALATTAAPLAAQGADPMPATYKAVQLSALKLQRKTLLAMADSMPERLYQQRATPIQRSFGEQIMHAAGSAAMIAGGFARSTRAQAALPDSTAAANTRAGLDAYINAAYNFCEATLAAQTSAERGATVNLFGNMMPGWKVWDEIHEHTFWTAGQVVANFRMNGMAPPGFGFF